VARAAPDELTIYAVDWWTAINVGLNDLTLRVAHTGTVQYQVKYWRWAGYSIGLSALLGLTGLVPLLTADVRGYLARNLTRGLPGLSVDQNLLIAWVMVGFWGFVWPWLLIALHKRPLRQLVERLVREVDELACQ
jgi:hypothetical protein